MQAFVNSSDLVPSGNQLNGEDSYIIRIEMIDGSSQFVNLSMDQVIALGIQNVGTVGAVGTECKEQPPKKPTSMLNYKIVQPADLNLCPKAPEAASIAKVEPSVPRGRPRKRPGEVPVKLDVVETKPTKVVKTSRTRYGRITKPPTHMEKGRTAYYVLKIVIKLNFDVQQDYEKIVTKIKPNLEHFKEVDTVEFEPIRTANTNTEQPHLLCLQSEPKKKNIPAHYKCPSCKKTYMGRNQMARHFQKNPDHREASHMLMQDCNAWYYLIEMALRANKGKRGEKFCKELMNLIKNARVMAKNFLKPAKAENSEYVVDEFLAGILDIQEGNYRFVESGICKDVNIFSFLLDDAFLDTNNRNNSNISNNSNKKTHQHLTPNFENSKPLHADNDKFIFPEVIPNSVEQISVSQAKNDPVIDLHFGSDITDVIDMPKATKEELFVFENTSTPLKANASKLETELNKNDFMHIFNEEFIAKDAKEHIFTDNLFLEKEEEAKSLEVGRNLVRNGKEVDIFRNTIPNILNFGASDEHMSTLLDKEKKTRKSDEFDLNKLHLEEFLPDAPVNNILDTSTGSDEIMNVDQFVNERFKNLTEPEGELQNMPNAPLNLDLPALECFNFNN